jgi:hypothetical protein
MLGGGILIKRDQRGGGVGLELYPFDILNYVGSVIISVSSYATMISYFKNI